MKLKDLQKTLIGYRDSEIIFFVDWKKYNLESIDSTFIEWKITFILKSEK